MTWLTWMMEFFASATLALMIHVLGVDAQECVGNYRTYDFVQAKVLLYRDIEGQLGKKARTIYCECAFDWKEHTVDWGECGLNFRKNEKRQRRTEVEHVVPAQRICGKTKYWLEPEKYCEASVYTRGSKKGQPKYMSGRECAQLHAPCSFAYVDLHNLWAAAGEINGDRSNHLFVNDIPGEPREYGKCDFEIGHNEAKGTVEPPASAKGRIARSTLYMYDTYVRRGLDVDMPAEYLNEYCVWHCTHPPSDLECRRNKLIEKVQGTLNPFTTAACLGSAVPTENCSETCLALIAETSKRKNTASPDHKHCGPPLALDGDSKRPFWDRVWVVAVLAVVSVGACFWVYLVYRRHCRSAGSSSSSSSSSSENSGYAGVNSGAFFQLFRGGSRAASPGEGVSGSNANSAGGGGGGFLMRSGVKKGKAGRPPSSIYALTQSSSPISHQMHGHVEPPL